MGKPPEEGQDGEEVGGELDLEQVMELEKREPLKLDFDEMLEDEGGRSDADPDPAATRVRRARPSRSRGARVGAASLESEGFLSRQEREAIERAKKETARPLPSRTATTQQQQQLEPVIRTTNTPYLKFALYAVLFVALVAGATWGGLQWRAGQREDDLRAIQDAQVRARQDEEERIRKIRETSARGEEEPGAPAP